MEEKTYTLNEIKSNMLKSIGRKFFGKINDQRRSLSTSRYNELMKIGLATITGSDSLQQKISVLCGLLSEFGIETKNSGFNANADVVDLRKYLEELLSCENLGEIIQGYGIYFSRFSRR